MRVQRGHIAIAGVLLVSGVSGCVGGDLNARPVLGGGLNVVGIPASGVNGPSDESLSDDPATLRSVSRSEWAAMRFVVPVDGTVHGPIRRWGLSAAGGSARRTGLWPTVQSAVEIGGPEWPVMVEGFGAWIEVIGEVLCMPLEMMRHPEIGEGGRRASPWGMYKRQPETGEWTNVSAMEVVRRGSPALERGKGSEMNPEEK